jgi:hypothetical protein
MKSAFFITILLILSISPVAVSAANPNGITLSPVSFNGNYRPSEFADTTFTLTNNTDQPLSLALEAVELRDELILTDAQSAAGWLTISPQAVDLSIGGSQEVVITVTVPDSTTLGAYYPAVLIKLASASTSTGVGTDIDVNLTFQLGINVTSELPLNSIEIRELSVTNPTLLGQAIVKYRIANPLNLFIKPIAYLQILNPQNQQVFTTTINETMVTVGAGEELGGTLTIDLPIDIKSTGQYRAELLVIDRQFGNTQITKTNFFVLPLWIPIGITLGVTLVWTILHRPRKSETD